MSDFRDKYWYTDIRDMSTLKELLYVSVDKYPDNPAFWVKKEKGSEYEPISYTLLKHDVEALGLELEVMGLMKNKIAVMGMGCYEWIVTYLAVVIGGGVIVPVDKELQSSEIENLMKTAECDTIFYTSTEAEKINSIKAVKNKINMEFYGDRTKIEENLKIPAITVHSAPQDVDSADDDTDSCMCYDWKELVERGEILLKSGKQVFADFEEDPDRMSVLLFTSGTTGNPKGVMLSQRNITSDIMDTCRIANIRPDDRTLSILPIHHTYECTFGMLLVLYRGASTAFCEGLKYITVNMNEVHNTVFIAVPLVLEMMYSKIWKTVRKQGKEKILKAAIKNNNKLKGIGIDMSRALFRQIHRELGGKLRLVITGAAAMSPNVFRGFEDLGITVLQGYGLTECTPLVSGTPQLARERYKKAGSVGLAVKQGDVKIINQDENGIGEILFRGPNVMLGYYKMEEETAEVMKDGWFCTGDLGFMDNEGWLYLTGRRKNIIVTKTGKNIYPEELEEVVNALPSVIECMVYGDHSADEDIVAVQVLADIDYITEELGKKPDDDEVYKYVKNQINEINMTMASYKRIKIVVIRKEDFARTTTRKIKRQDNI